MLWIRRRDLFDDFVRGRIVEVGFSSAPRGTYGPLKLGYQFLTQERRGGFLLDR